MNKATVIGTEKKPFNIMNFEIIFDYIKIFQLYEHL